MFLNGSDYLSLSDGWLHNFGMGWVGFFHYRIFTASYAKLKVAQSKSHFRVKLSCKIQDPYFFLKNKLFPKN